MQSIAVIGAGTMGNGIAHVFAMNGFSVKLIDVSEESLKKATATITKNLDRMLSKGSINEETKNATLKNLTTHSAMDAAKDADLVVEAATENVDIKLKIF